MKGFLFDENIPARILFSPSFPIVHVSALGASLSDTQIWGYAKQNDLVIVTKDADFSNRSMVDDSSVKVVRLCFGNMRRRAYHEFLASIWPTIEELIARHSLIHVYPDRIDTMR